MKYYKICLILVIGISLSAAFVSDDLLNNHANAQNSTNQFYLLRIIVNVTGGNASPTDFFIKLYNTTDPNKFTYTFQGSKEGTIVSLQSGNYSIDASASIISMLHETTFSGDCTVVANYIAQINMTSGEKKLCIITNSF